ncbi:MAG: hypothetical protein ACLRXC_09235 [[Clostridium] leptum]
MPSCPMIKSPELTAEWESMLKQVERGEMTADAFMEGIAGLIRDLIRQNTAPILPIPLVENFERGQPGSCWYLSPVQRRCHEGERLLL